MARKPRIPPELTQHPFTLSEAREAGLSKRSLQGKAWRRLGSELYCRVGVENDNWRLLAAWQRRMPQGVFTGLSAAWLYRLDVDPADPVELAVASNSGVRTQAGLLVCRSDLIVADAVTVRGLRCATARCTFETLRRRMSRVEYLVLADQALRKGLGRFDNLAEPAESPMETRLRWLLIEGGLPPPQVQARLSFGRADLYYPHARLVIEYDGSNHRDRLIDDDRRQNLLVNAGYRVLRFTAADRPQAITAQVREALASGTAPPKAAASA